MSVINWLILKPAKKCKQNAARCQKLPVYKKCQALHDSKSDFSMSEIGCTSNRLIP